MHLRSGHFIKSGYQSVRDFASKILSKESVTQKVGLETIVENTADNLSTISESSMASQGSHPSQQVGTSLKYNMTLEYQMENSHGAKIYVDPIGRSAVKIDDHDIEFCQEVPVSVQGDRYMDPYATMYLVVDDPLDYNQWGVRVDKNKGKEPMGEEVEVSPPVDPSLFKQINWVVLQWMLMDDPTMGLYYLEDPTGPTLFLEAKKANPITYTDKKVMYVFLKTNIILDPKVVYKDRYDIEYLRVPKEVVQTYHFGGLPLYDAIGQVRTVVPETSTHSLPKEMSTHTAVKSRRDQVSTALGVPLPTSNTKIGGGIGINDGHPIIRWSTTPQANTRPTVHETMGDFPLRPPAHVQSQRKLRPSNFKKLVEKFDETKDPHYHMANIRQVINAENVYEWHTQFEGFGMTLDGAALD